MTAPIATSDYLALTPRTRQRAALDVAKAALQIIVRSSSDSNSQDYALEALLRMRAAAAEGGAGPVEIARNRLRRLSATSKDVESRAEAVEALTRLETLTGGGR
jgi:hypothetical protein